MKDTNSSSSSLSSFLIADSSFVVSQRMRSEQLVSEELRTIALVTF
jgi:hypothetical protein